LKKLREQSLIYSRQGVGSFVRQNGIKDPLGFSPVENLSDLRKCYEFREVLEPACAQAAAERRTDADLKAIERALALLKDATTQRRHRADADYDFHLSIARASGNQYFQTAIESLKDHIAVGMKYHGISEHEKIYQAIKTGNKEDAFLLMKKHITGSRSRLFDE
jgi:GntR family transcriptional regulator, transcriptional repressor for pyruvate dehydrogenase complex